MGFYAHIAQPGRITTVMVQPSWCSRVLFHQNHEIPYPIVIHELCEFGDDEFNVLAIGAWKRNKR